MDTTNTEVNVSSFRVRTDLHLLRKFWHMGTGVIGLGLFFHYNADPRDTAWVLLAIALGGFLLDTFRLKLENFNVVAQKVMKPFMRESERNSYSGLPFYALGVSLSLFLFPEKIAVLSIFFLVFSDPISSLVGILFGKEKILPNKSLQGCMAGFITCYTISLVFGLVYNAPGLGLILFAFVGGIIGMLSEILSAFNIDDNLTIPVASGLGLSLLNMLIPVL